MELFALKINWPEYQRELANGEVVPRTSRLEFQCEEPEDTGSRNIALSDFFPLLRPHLPDDVCNAIGTLIGAIASCSIDGWPPYPNDAPPELHEDRHADIGLLYSPATVARIVASFQSVPLDRIATSLSSAWAKKSTDAADYQFASIKHFDGPDDFLQYLLGWCAAFKEASNEGHGIGIGCS